MATPPSTFDQLPDVVWRNTCKFLSLRDILELHDTHHGVQNGCRHFLQTTTGYFVMQYDIGDICERLSSSDKKVIERFGNLLSRVIFGIYCFRIKQDSITCMEKNLASSSSRLSSLYMKCYDWDWGSEVSFFVHCPDPTEPNWSIFWKAVQKQGTDVDLEVKLYDIDSCVLEHQRQPLPASDLRCQFLTDLEMNAPCHVSREFKASRRDQLSGPLIGFLSNFTNLKRLSLQLDEIDDSLLNQLAQRNSVLTELNVSNDYRTYSSLAKDVSADVWTAVTMALPSLRVKCIIVNTWTGIQELMKHYDAVFKPNAPMHTIDTADRCDKQGMSRVIGFCENFPKTLHSVCLQMEKHKHDLFPRQLEERLNSLCDRATHLRHMQCEEHYSLWYFVITSGNMTVEKSSEPKDVFNCPPYHQATPPEN